MGRTATASFLFVDLVGSTRILHQLGDDRNDEFQRQYMAALRGAVAAHGGDEVKCLGDGLMAVFPGSVAAAVGAAVDMQQAIRSLGRGEFSVEPTLRVGISVGEATEGPTDWSGTPVVEAARLEAAAAPGTILVNDLVRVLIGRRGAFAFTPAGDFELKGFPEPLTCATVDWEDAAPAAPTEDPTELQLLPTGAEVPVPPALSMFRLGELVGRAKELEALDAAFVEAQHSGPLLATLEGEPGIGKTRLLAEFAESAHDRGATILAGRCTPDPIWPFEPFADALRGYVASNIDEVGPRLDALPRSLVSLVHPSEDAAVRQRRGAGVPVDEGPELVDAVSLVFEDLARRAPLLVVLDDLHWAAPDTVRLLRHLFRAGSGGRILVVGTFRDTEVLRAHPLHATVSELDRQRRTRRHRVAGLDEADIASLLRGHPDIDSADALVRVLRERTDGNPFFLEEILRHLGDATAADALPSGVRESVSQRVAALGERVGKALRAAAVLGPTFRLSVLERMPAAGDDPDGLLDALDAAVDARLVVEDPADPGDGYAFAHALVRQALEDDVSTARRARMHTQAWRALEQLPPTAENIIAMARHALRSGAAQVGDVAQVVLEAAEAALDREQFGQARELAREALGRLEDASPDLDRARATALWISGSADYLLEAESRGIADLRRAGELARRAGDVVIRARAAESLVFSTVEWGKPSADLRELHDAIEALGPEHAALRAELLGTEALVVSTAELQYDVALSIGREAVEAARVSDDAVALFHSLGSFERLLDDGPHYEERRRIVDEIAGLVDRMPAMRWPWGAVAASRAHLALQCGDPKFRTHIAEYVSTRDRAEWGRAYLSFMVAKQALVDGDFDLAAVNVHEGLASSSDPDVQLIGLGQLLILERERGADVVGLLDAAVDETGGLISIPAAHALALAEAGRHDEAVEEADRVARALFDKPRQPTAVAAAVLLAETAARAGARPWIEELAVLLRDHSGRTALVAQSVCLGSVDRALGQLAAVAGQVDAADEHFRRAVEVESRLDAPPLLARTRYWWGHSLLDRNEVARALETIEEARAAADRLGMVLLREQCDSLIESASN